MACGRCASTQEPVKRTGNHEKRLIRSQTVFGVVYKWPQTKPPTRRTRETWPSGCEGGSQTPHVGTETGTKGKRERHGAPEIKTLGRLTRKRPCGLGAHPGDRAPGETLQKNLSRGFVHRLISESAEPHEGVKISAIGQLWITNRPLRTVGRGESGRKKEVNSTLGFRKRKEYFGKINET